ncbi:CPBP family intramembrane metalloprotease [Clostridiaceae bacterium M8S5]|nr:CPBP family intramembrane metalloprotease [Clostridiaceae bacterium M8S5]
MNLQKSTIKADYKFISIALIIYTVIWTIIENTKGNVTNPTNQTYYAVCLMFIVIVSSQLITNYLSCFCYKKHKKEGYKSLFRIKRISIKQLMLGIVIFISFNGISLFLLQMQDLVLRNFGVKFVMNNYPIADNLLTLTILVLTAGVLIPIGEELFFRGLLLKGNESISITFSITISAFFFAICHNNPYRLTTLFLFGILCGVMVYYTGSIIIGVVIHILNNTVFEVVSYINGKEVMAKQYGDITNTPYSILNNYYFLFILFIACTIICLLSLRRLKKISVIEVNTNKLDINQRKKAKTSVIASLAICFVIYLLKVL